MSYIDVLLIEDDRVLGGALRQRLRLEGLSAVWVENCSQAVEAFRRQRLRPAFILADIRLPDGSGEDLYRRIIPYVARSTIVFATAYGELAQAVRLVAAGATDYLTKPYDVDALIPRIHAAVEAFDDEDASPALPENPFLGSPATEAVAAAIQKLAPLDLTVLLQGETGVGKELTARFMHANSSCSSGPFVPVNCASLADELVESQLFGHRRGAFSGAREAHRGLIEHAGGGTLFLDEVGELSPRAQAALLRVLEDKRFLPLGDSTPLKADCRFVASTNIDLAEAVRRQAFRADLYYRLAVGHLNLPPLRERPQDILPLAERFLRDWSATARPAATFSGGARDALLRHAWPGNIRELKNRVQRAAVIADGPALEESDLFPEGSLGEPVVIPDLNAARADAELRSIQQAIAVSGGQLGLAAKRLGISRTTLWKKLRQR
ncbi:Regulatory protein AtoC [Achromobacter anxifer]|uniref:sigma-54-dependent transcriptional regulator n=1 Tax=Achromobacter anxifer TaxID=1287737 RepID=UPI00155CB9CA|nr:sigma-54 dependent transcriptional regulator [Achromobacter anxifer]CAB5511977.1 Regulatory protein AtoC [Achromobacter anxifer]